jgi:hypothetical protein
VVYIQWSFIQPYERMKLHGLNVNGWNWKTKATHVFSHMWKTDPEEKYIDKNQTRSYTHL